MCTAVIRWEPQRDWPLLVAFVRDEDRTRTWERPQRWWPQQPSVLGGRDARHGGTWFAVDTDEQDPQVAFVLNRRDPDAPVPDPATRVTRGVLPLGVLARGGFAVGLEELTRFDPFNLVHASRAGVQCWQWTGTRLEQAILEPGVHVVTSHGASARQRAVLPRFASAPMPTPSVAATTEKSWGAWIGLLDGREAVVGDAESIVVAGVAGHPTFGTVSGTLVAAAATGHVRMDFNPTPDLDPGSWSRVDTSME